jgi:nicotinamide riboside transporter PnuC
METYYLIMTFYGYWSWVRPEKRVQGSRVQGSRVQGSKVQGSKVQGSNVQSSEFKAQDTVLEAEPSTHNSERPIRHFPKKLILPWLLVIAAVWGTIYWILVTFTDSSVPLTDSFTTALSIVGVWALAHKYLEQWFVWIVVDVITCGLYFYKDIPFKASLYGLYVIIAIAGYFNWRKKMKVDYNKEEIKGKNEPIFRNNS